MRATVTAAAAEAEQAACREQDEGAAAAKAKAKAEARAAAEFECCGVRWVRARARRRATRSANKMIIEIGAVAALRTVEPSSSSLVENGAGLGSADNN